MKKLLILVLFLAAMSGISPHSNAQVIYSQNFDTMAYFQSIPAGWTNSVFNYAFDNNNRFEGYPVWFQNNLAGNGTINGNSYYPDCNLNNYQFNSYDPFGCCSLTAGPYGTQYEDFFPYPTPLSNGQANNNCDGEGFMVYAAEENGYNDANAGSRFGYFGEFASPALDLNAAYAPYNGVGTIRLTFFLQTGYITPDYTEQVKVYINSSPVSTGGTLIDSIYPWGDPKFTLPADQYGSPMWTQFQYTIPSSYYTNSNAYIIFRATPSTNDLSYNIGGDIDLDDFSISYIPPCVTPLPTQTPSNLVFTTSASIVNGSFTAPANPPSGYVVVRSVGPLLGAPVNSTTYNVGNVFGANGIVVADTSGTSFTDPGLTPGTAYTYTIFPYSSGSACSITYYAPTPLIGIVTTGSTNTYTWNRIVSASFTNSANWTPARVVPDPTDILVFNNGISDTVTGAPTDGPIYTQGIGRLSVANNTQVHLQSVNPGILTTNVNGIANATGVDIAVGSALILDGDGGITLNFGAGSLPDIEGTLELNNNNGLNVVDFSNSVATIGTQGQLAAGGTMDIYPFVVPSASSLIINGTFNNEYTTVGGFIVYPATWNPGSTVLISGYTTSTVGPLAASLNQPFSNFVYNAYNQTSVCNWNGVHFNVSDTFNITSTGTGTWALAGTQAYNDTLNNFVQAGGTFDLSTGASVAPGTQVLTFTGAFNQLGGNIKSSGTLTTQPNLFFNGTGGTQNVTLSNAPAGPIVYRVGNAAGINLTGINSLGSTPVLAINSGGGVRISTTAANPINTSLLLQYATTNSTLTFDTSGNITATPAVWPSTTAPFNVVINVNTGNAVKVPFNATIPGTLTFLSGDIDMSSYGLTVGNSTLATNQGTILEPAAGTSYANVLGNGNVRLTTGSLTRWFGTAGLPIGPNITASNGLTSQGFFPVSYGPSNRNVSVFFSAGNGLGAGGTITLTHNAATGTTALSPAVADGSYIMDTRTNASWSFSTGNLLTLNSGASFGIKATAGNLLNPININQLRLTHVNADPGANGGGGGSAPNFTATRTGLLGTDLTGSPWYFAANATDINTGASGVYTQVTTGPWTTASNWDVNAVPSATSIAVINPGVVSDISSASCVAKSLTVLGTVNNSTSGNVLNVDSSLVNNGSVNITSGSLLVNSNNTASQLSLFANVGIYNYGNFILNGGTIGIGLGTLNGGNKPFENYGGLSVGTGSTLNINGNFASLGGSYFTQSGGNITVDGNTGETNLVNKLANSVPHGRALFSLQTPAIHFYGGNVTIVDPPADTTYLNPFSGLPAAFEFVVPVGTPMFNDSSAHTFSFGDGISTDAGGNTRGFLLMTTGSGISSLFNFSNLVINGGAGTNRAVTTYYTGVGVQNSMIINSGGEYQLSNRDLVLNGSLAVNNGGKLTSDDAGTLTFGQLLFTGGGTAIAPAAPTLANQPQQVTGSGIFVNGTTNTASLGNIKTLSPPYVVFNTGSNLSFPSSDLITFTPENGVPSRIIMATGALAETGASATSNNASATNGWIVGTYQKHAIIGAMGSGNFKYPIGDSNNYTPVSISGTGSNVITAGDIAVSTQPTYASTLSFSSFNPLKLVDRTYTITTSPSLRLAPNSIGISFTFVPGDITPTANYQNFKVGVNPAGTTWYYLHSIAQAATSISIDTLAPTGLAGLYQIGEGCPPTVITTQPQSTGGCVGGLPITFTVAATGASLQYQWYHNDVAIPSANAPVYTRLIPTLSDSGLYYAVITGACALPDTSSKVTFTIGAPAPIIDQPLSQGVCTGSPIHLCVTALNAGTYRWQKDDVDLPLVYQNSSCITIPAGTILDAGRYRVIIGNGCANDTSLDAVININTLPTATVSTTTSLAFCNGSNVLLTANGTALSGYSYQWSRNGATIAGATNQVYSATNAGKYSVVVTDVNSCSSTSTPDSVTVFALPPASVLSTSSNVFCNGGSVKLTTNFNPSFTYNWQLNGNNIPGATQDSFRATASGNYSVAVTNINNCTGTSAATLVTALPVPSGPIAASGSTALCNNTSVTLTAPSGAGYTYQWYDDGIAIPGANLISYNANAAGLYNAVVISNSYCIDTTSPVSVTQFPLPGNVINASGPTTFCQGGKVTLSAGTGPGINYQWQLNGTNVGVTTDSILASPTAPGTYSYSVVISNSAGCTEIATPVNVTVNSLPNPVITGSGGSLSTQGGQYSYQWYLDGVPVAANGNTNTYTAATGGDYTVYVTNSNGCGSMSALYHYSLGVSNVANNQNVRVFPNPARDIVYIDAPFEVNVSVNSLDGKELFSKANAKSINIAALANGIYMIRISDAAGNLVSVEKLVKADN